MITSIKGERGEKRILDREEWGKIKKRKKVKREKGF